MSPNMNSNIISSGYITQQEFEIKSEEQQANSKITVSIDQPNDLNSHLKQIEFRQQQLDNLQQKNKTSKKKITYME